MDDLPGDVGYVSVGQTSQTRAVQTDKLTRAMGRI